jgi:hypothetical protein
MTAAAGTKGAAKKMIVLSAGRASLAYHGMDK